MASIAGYPPQEGRHGYVVLPAMTEGIENETGFPVCDHEHYIVVRDCPSCHKGSRVKVPAQGLWDWEHGAFVQSAFPGLDVSQREQVLTGIHSDCWDRMFPDE